MKEILIAAGGLLAILAIALTVGYLRSGERKKNEDVVEVQVRILESNVKLAKDELKKAVDLGTLFSVGKETIDPKDPSKLFAPFKGNSKIYNVIYNRDYKDKKQTEKHDMFALVDDPDHRALKELNKTGIPDEKDLIVKYGLASDKDKLIPVVLATKIIHPAKEDLVNTGGKIMVVVLAEEDDFFRKAIQKVIEGPKQPAPTETKPTETKPAEPKAPAPAENKAPAETKAAAPAETK